MAGEKPVKKKCKAYPIGYSQIDIAEVRTEEGTLSLFGAIDRSCQVAYAELHEEANKMVTAPFLRNLIAAIPDKIHTVLTDYGIQFTNRKRDVCALHHLLGRVCHDSDIEHRLTKTNHLWTTGQVERMHRPRKEATLKKYYYQTHHHLKEHL